jgi:PAS domain S-box-containing protein
MSTVLIVDDDTTLLQALPDTVSLRLPCTRVETADSGRAALRKIMGRDYEVIVTDWKMPDIDGLNLFERIREVRPTTPTLMMTGTANRELRRQALARGFYALIDKPIDRDLFVTWLKRALDLRAWIRKCEREKAKLRVAIERSKRFLQELRRVRRQSQLYRALMESWREALLIARLEGTILACNTLAADLWGWSREQLDLKKLGALIPLMEHLPQDIELLARLRSGESGSVVCSLAHRDGSRVTATVSLSPLANQKGRLDAILLVVSPSPRLPP